MNGKLNAADCERVERSPWRHIRDVFEELPVVRAAGARIARRLKPVTITTVPQPIVIGVDVRLAA